MGVSFGETFSKRHLFTAGDIAEFAARAGDWNPLHHDAAMASGTRFGALIASGAQTSALLMGMAADYLSSAHDSVALDFSFRFRRGLPAGTDALLAWRVTAVERSPKLGGDLITLAGEIIDDAGTCYVTAEGRAVIWPKMPPSPSPKE